MSDTYLRPEVLALVVALVAGTLYTLRGGPQAPAGGRAPTVFVVALGTAVFLGLFQLLS